MSIQDLHAAARAGDVPAVLRLLAAGVPATGLLRNTTALHVAAADDQVGVIGALLDHGMPVDHVAAGKTALLDAARKGKVAALEALLDRGASLTHHEANGETALHFAAAGDHVKAVRLLVQRGASLDQVTTRSPLLSAAMYTKSFKGFAALLELGADPNGTGSKYYVDTVLHSMVRDAKVAAVKLLLARGADPLRLDHQGRTALDLAKEGTKSEHREILELLTAPAATPAPAAPAKTKAKTKAAAPRKAGKPVHTVLSAVPMSHAGGVSNAAWGGDRIATVGFDRHLRVWDARSGEPLWSAKVSSSDTPFAVAVSADGAVVVSGNKAPIVFDAATGDKLVQGEPNKHRMVAAAVTDAHVVTVSERILRTVDRATGATLDHRVLDRSVDHVAVSPAGDRVLVVWSEGRALYALPKLTPLVEEGGLGIVYTFGWDAAGPWVGGHGHLLRLDPTTLAVVSDVEGLPGMVLAATPGAVVTREPHGDARLVDLAGRTERARWCTDRTFAQASGDGARLVVGGGRGVHVRDAATGEVVLGAPRSLVGAVAVEIDADGSVVAFGHVGPRLYRFGGAPADIEPPPGAQHLVALTDSGPVWWVAGADADALVFCARTGEEQRRVVLPAELRRGSAVLSPSGAHALVREGSRAWSVDVAAGRVEWTAPEEVRALACMGDDGFVYAAGRRVHALDWSGAERLAFDVAPVSFGEIIELHPLPARGWIAVLLGNDVRVHDAATGAEVAWYPPSKQSGSYHTPRHGQHRLASDERARRLAVVTVEHVRMWNLETHKEEDALAGDASLRLAAMRPDGSGVVVTGDAGVNQWAW